MMLLPTVGGGEIDLTGEVISRPYIHMTSRLMEEFGVQCVIDGAHIGVPAGSYVMHDCVVEADWSAASYWYALAALTPDCHIVLEGLREDSPAEFATAETLHKQELAIDLRVQDIIRHTAISKNIPNLP